MAQSPSSSSEGTTLVRIKIDEVVLVGKQPRASANFGERADHQQQKQHKQQ